MKNTYNYLLLISSILFGGKGFAQTTTFNHTGAVQTYTVPSGVNSIEIKTWGAKGGGANGGLGGYTKGELVVTPGTVLYVYVGGTPTAQLGPGGFNGGGSVTALPCGGPSDGFPGGGASDVRTSTSLNDRLIVAGGGGGQGYSNGLGGAGGSTTGGDGAASWIQGTHGRGATQTAGGAGGYYTNNQGQAPAGTFGQGGNSGPINTYCTGGAGGGGWYGGGGGYVSSGGGGSSYVSSSLTGTEMSSGVREGNGLVEITVLCTPINVAVSNYTICFGETVTLTASSNIGANVSWDNGVISGVPFSPTTTSSYTVSSTSTLECSSTVTIVVNDVPTLTTGPDITLCDDTVITLSATSNEQVIWSDGIINNQPFSPTIGSHTYTATATNSVTGCQNSANVTVNYNPITITFSGTDEIYGLDGTITATITGGYPPYGFEWIHQGIVIGNTSLTLTGLVAGEYTLSVTDSQLCTITNSFEIGSQLGINSVSMSGNVYPNPTKDKLSIFQNGSFEYTVVDLTGKEILSGKGNDHATISLSAFTNGTYLLKVNTGNENNVIKVVKQ